MITYWIFKFYAEVALYAVQLLARFIAESPEAMDDLRKEADAVRRSLGRFVEEQSTTRDGGLNGLLEAEYVLKAVKD